MTKPIAFAALLLALSGAASAQALQVQSPVPYAADNDIADNIKSECTLDKQLAELLERWKKISQAGGADRGETEHIYVTLAGFPVNLGSPR